MKIIILGAGVIGVTAAWELLRDGHEVEVIEREAVPADAASSRNAGLVAAGHAFAWASPKVPKILLKSLYRNDQAFRIRPTLDPDFWRWTIRFLGQCTARAADINTRRKYRLCRYSHERLEHITAETAIEFDRLVGGLMYYYRTPQTLKAGVAHMRILQELGQDMQVLDPDAMAGIDPVYGPVRDKLAGAVFCPSDESGNSGKFTASLADLCAKKGAVFRYGTAVERLVADGDRIERVVTDKGDISGDAYVLSFGAWSAEIAKTVGTGIPVYPVKGYTMTAPVNGANNPPRIGAVDEDRLVAFTRMGEQVRFTSTAQFSGFDLNHKPSDFANMMGVAHDILAGAADYQQCEYKACLRPMTPEGTPVFGLGQHSNLYFNTGHGHMGWTMSCGAARIIADIIAGKDAAVPLDGMGVRG